MISGSLEDAVMASFPYSKIHTIHDNRIHECIFYFGVLIIAAPFIQTEAPWAHVPERQGPVPCQGLAVKCRTEYFLLQLVPCCAVLIFAGPCHAKNVHASMSVPCQDIPEMV